MPHSEPLTSSASYSLDREELLRMRNIRLLTSDRDYVFFALQIDYPGRLNPSIDVSAFCARWELNEGNLYKAIGELQNKGIVISISSQLDLQFQAS